MDEDTCGSCIYPRLFDRNRSEARTLQVKAPYSYTRRSAGPPGAVIAAQMMQEDENAAPEYGERVPYVVYYGKPKSSIRDQAIHPLDMLKSKDLLLHGRYYIRKKIIPPLSRIFNLIGADIMSWFDAVSTCL